MIGGCRISDGQSMILNSGGNFAYDYVKVISFLFDLQPEVSEPDSIFPETYATTSRGGTMCSCRSPTVDL